MRRPTVRRRSLASSLFSGRLGCRRSAPPSATPRPRPPDSSSTTGSTRLGRLRPRLLAQRDPRHLRQHHGGGREVGGGARPVLGDQARGRQGPVRLGAGAECPGRRSVHRGRSHSLHGGRERPDLRAVGGHREGRRVLDQRPDRRPGPGRWLLRRLHQPVLEVPRQQRRRPHEHLDPRRQHLQRLHADRLGQRPRAGSMAVSGRTCSNNRPLAVGAKNYPHGCPKHSGTVSSTTSASTGGRSPPPRSAGCSPPDEAPGPPRRRMDAAGFRGGGPVQ